MILPSGLIVRSGFILGTQPLGDSITSCKGRFSAFEARRTQPLFVSFQAFSYTSNMCSVAEEWGFA